MKRSLFALLVALLTCTTRVAAQPVGDVQTITVVDSGTACVTAPTACATYALDNQTGSVTLSVSGTWTGTLRFEGTNNGGIWTTVTATNVATATAVTTTTASGLFSIPNAGLIKIRARATAAITGTAVVTAAKGLGSGGGSSGGGGGGGAVTVADGADVALGATTDTAAGDSDATLNAHARETAKRAALIDGKTPALGQALAAASVPVVLTAAQLSTLTPTAGLTDTQLRASAVPISVATIPSHAVTNAGTFAVQATATGAASATLANVASSATSVTCQASNAARTAWAVYNDSTAVLYLKFGATASATSFTVQLPAAAYYEMPRTPYTGIIDCIWASANGSARVTEY